MSQNSTPKPAAAATAATDTGTADDVASLKARIAELEAENKGLAADNETATAALAAKPAKAEKQPKREALREYTKDEQALAKAVGVDLGYILSVNAETGTVVTVDGRKLRKAA